LTPASLGDIIAFSNVQRSQELKRSLRYYLDLIAVLTQKDLAVRYKSNLLGYFWSVAHPLAFAFVFFIAFKLIMRIQIEAYSLFLISVLFPWQWFGNTMSVAPTAFLANASIIKKVNFPRNVLPFSLVLQDMIHYILSIPVIILFMFIYHKVPTLAWLYGLPILLVIQFCLNYGIALAIASINLFFRDLERLAAIFTTLLFYFTPVIYPISMIPEKYHLLINLNPMTPLMVSWRNLFLEGRVDFVSVGVAAGFSLVTLGVGYWIYEKLSWKFAEVL
jgi:lipopolysaccharide transport system permease protein